MQDLFMIITTFYASFRNRSNKSLHLLVPVVCTMFFFLLPTKGLLLNALLDT